jgi:hypothetical protein
MLVCIFSKRLDLVFVEDVVHDGFLHRLPGWLTSVGVFRSNCQNCQFQNCCLLDYDIRRILQGKQAIGNSKMIRKRGHYI